MPPVKSNVESDRIALTKVLNLLEKTENEFIKAVEKLDDLKKDTLTNYTLEIDELKKTKEENMLEIENSFKQRKQEIDNELKNNKIQSDQLLSEYRHEGAVKILKEFGEEPVDSDEYQQLRNDQTALEETHKKELEALRKELESKGNIEKHSALENLQLKHKAEIATLKAENDMANREIESMKQNIKDLKEQIREQQQLTKDVAESSRQGSINQSFGK
jgi:DNA repair exonuclease SbcCD ATPase subunit